MKKTAHEPKQPETRNQPPEPEQHPFREMLAVLSWEDLIRLRTRLQKKGKKRLIALLTSEIERKKRNGEE